ncbi:hypothetical protein K469DRAFT_633 [Zopfia rhizophila CBS 207.26]|uniref:Uncharacterized protein n=1 Tax=Zopfia rhizophila CBS 207.26 TaxID=1314779 RepID=A0A6A6EYG1_9PEZI|nr:hypothetical protein K469DRAFT_633 [Zopfia rhizophila CBS 207.26]
MRRMIHEVFFRTAVFSAFSRAEIHRVRMGLGGSIAGRLGMVICFGLPLKLAFYILIKGTRCMTVAL